MKFLGRLCRIIINIVLNFISIEIKCVLTAEISICYILWMWLYNFSRISSHSRTGRISAVFPEVLARYVNSTAVHCSAAPRGVSINRGASVVDSVAKDEGEDTVATGTRAWRGGGGGGGHG